MKLIRAAAVLFAFLPFLAPAAHAIEAYRMAPDEKVVLDGRLDDGAWAKAPLLDEFFEISPRDKVAAPVKSEARFAYDGHSLYVA